MFDVVSAQRLVGLGMNATDLFETAVCIIKVCNISVMVPRGVGWGGVGWGGEERGEGRGGEREPEPEPEPGVKAHVDI